MKNLPIILFLLSSSIYCKSQVPEVSIYDSTGTYYTLSDYMNDNDKYLISLWATWNTPAKKQNGNWQVYTSNWIDNCKVKILYVSIDDKRNHATIRYNWRTGRYGWKGELFFVDVDSALAAFNISTVPQIYLFEKGNIVFERSGYLEGDEIELNDTITENCFGTSISSFRSKNSFNLYQNDNSIIIQSFF
jgi:hypothetical protein